MKQRQILHTTTIPGAKSVSNHGLEVILSVHREVLCGQPNDSQRVVQANISFGRLQDHHSIYDKCNAHAYHLKEFARTSSMPPNVRYVTVQVSRFHFHNIIAPKIVWEDELNEGDLKVIGNWYRLQGISGLKDFRIAVEGDPHSARTDEEKAVFDFNTRKLEAFLRPIVMSARVHRQVSTLGDAAALYPGSLVSCVSSEIVEETISEGKPQRKIHKPELQLLDLPSNVEELKALVMRDGEAVVDLIADLKRRESLASAYF